MVEYKCDAWGKCHTTVVDSTATEIANLNPFRYRSYYLDTETGFYFLKTRYYDPEIGRFMTIDDLSYLDSENINGLNLYAYCGDNPIMHTDPSGHSILGTIALLLLSGVIVHAATLTVSYAALHHEWGHSMQELIMGTPAYLLFVALPSVINYWVGEYNKYIYSDPALSEKLYYSKVWERIADLLGGVKRNDYFPFWTWKNFMPW